MEVWNGVGDWRLRGGKESGAKGVGGQEKTRQMLGVRGGWEGRRPRECKAGGGAGQRGGMATARAVVRWRVRCHRGGDAAARRPLVSSPSPCSGGQAGRVLSGGRGGVGSDERWWAPQRTEAAEIFLFVRLAAGPSTVERATSSSPETKSNKKNVIFRGKSTFAFLRLLGPDRLKVKIVKSKF
jgi:hypothetical protein